MAGVCVCVCLWEGGGGNWCKVDRLGKISSTG